MSNKAMLCVVEFQEDRGIIYVWQFGRCLIRISGLTKEQFDYEQIDVKAEQPRSHNETVYGYAQDGPLPDGMAPQPKGRKAK